MDIKNNFIKHVGDKAYFSNFDEVAVIPPPVEQEEGVTNSISSLMSKNKDLKPLTVLFHSEPLHLVPGDCVFLRPESYTLPCMSMVYRINGQPFVLVPKSAIIGMVKGVI